MKKKFIYFVITVVTLIAISGTTLAIRSYLQRKEFIEQQTNKMIASINSCAYNLLYSKNAPNICEGFADLSEAGEILYSITYFDEDMRFLYYTVCDYIVKLRYMSSGDILFYKNCNTFKNLDAISNWLHIIQDTNSYDQINLRNFNTEVKPLLLEYKNE